MLKSRQQVPELQKVVTFEERANKLQVEVANANKVKTELQAEVDQLQKDIDTYRSTYQP